MYLTLIIGATGQGKSAYIKANLLNGNRVYVFDVQNEYNFPVDRMEVFERGTQILSYKKKKEERIFTEFTHPQMRHTGMDKNYFINRCARREPTPGYLTGYNIIVEEATGFFRGNISDEFVQVVLSKRHTRCNWFLCFHSITSTPPQIWQFVNYLILFKTGEERKELESKYPSKLKYFDEVEAMPYSDEVYIQQHGEYELLKQR